MISSPMIQSTHPLQAHVSGSVITREDAAYDEVRRGWNLSIDHHPSVILVAQNAQDVIAGIRFADDAGLHIAVQTTGHGIYFSANDSLLILTSQMNAVTVDAARQTVQVEGGAIWQQVIEATSPHGLAPLLGSSPHVGVIGYTLGGGVGWLALKYGFAADSVRWLDIVSADGVLRRASPAENSELFWGVRGGGGNFGVVTAMEFAVYPVATIYGGDFIYSGELAHEALRLFRDWVKTVPDNLTSSIKILKFPDLPQMPDELRGKIQVIVAAAYKGDVKQGEAWMQQWLEWQTPLSNTFHEMPFADIGTISNDRVQPAAVYGSNGMFDELSDEALQKIALHATNSESPLVLAELRHVGGAMKEMTTNAIGNRDTNFYFQVGGPLFAPDAKAKSAAYIRQIMEDLRPYLRGTVYQNFMSGDEAKHRAKDAYSPETYARLLTLKATYDPDNRFRFGYQLVNVN